MCTLEFLLKPELKFFLAPMLHEQWHEYHDLIFEVWNCRLQHAGWSQQTSLGARRDRTYLVLEVIVSQGKPVDRCSVRLDI